MILIRIDACIKFGVRYKYEVTTRYHLKMWDEGENELQLCYETTDGDGYFVVGCGVAW